MQYQSNPYYGGGLGDDIATQYAKQNGIVLSANDALNASMPVEPTYIDPGDLVGKGFKAVAGRMSDEISGRGSMYHRLSILPPTGRWQQKTLPYLVQNQGLFKDTNFNPAGIVDGQVRPSAYGILERQRRLRGGNPQDVLGVVEEIRDTNSRLPYDGAGQLEEQALKDLNEFYKAMEAGDEQTMRRLSSQKPWMFALYSGKLANKARQDGVEIGSPHIPFTAPMVTARDMGTKQMVAVKDPFWAAAQYEADNKAEFASKFNEGFPETTLYGKRRFGQKERPPVPIVNVPNTGNFIAPSPQAWINTESGLDYKPTYQFLGGVNETRMLNNPYEDAVIPTGVIPSKNLANSYNMFFDNGYVGYQKGDTIHRAKIPKFPSLVGRGHWSEAVVDGEVNPNANLVNFTDPDTMALITENERNATPGVRAIGKGGEYDPSGASDTLLRWGSDWQDNASLGTASYGTEAKQFSNVVPVPPSDDIALYGGQQLPEVYRYEDYVNTQGVVPTQFKGAVNTMNDFLVAQEINREIGRTGDSQLRKSMEWDKKAGSVPLSIRMGTRLDKDGNPIGQYAEVYDPTGKVGKFTPTSKKGEYISSKANQLQKEGIGVRLVHDTDTGLPTQAIMTNLMTGEDLVPDMHIAGASRTSMVPARVIDGLIGNAQRNIVPITQYYDHGDEGVTSPVNLQASLQAATDKAAMKDKARVPVSWQGTPVDDAFKLQGQIQQRAQQIQKALDLGNISPEMASQAITELQDAQVQLGQMIGGATAAYKPAKGSTFRKAASGLSTEESPIQFPTKAELKGQGMKYSEMGINPDSEAFQRLPKQTQEALLNSARNADTGRITQQDIEIANTKIGGISLSDTPITGEDVALGLINAGENDSIYDYAGVTKNNKNTILDRLQAMRRKSDEFAIAINAQANRGIEDTDLIQRKQALDTLMGQYAATYQAALEQTPLKQGEASLKNAGRQLELNAQKMEALNPNVPSEGIVESRFAAAAADKERRNAQRMAEQVDPLLEKEWTRMVDAGEVIVPAEEKLNYFGGLKQDAVRAVGGEYATYPYPEGYNPEKIKRINRGYNDAATEWEQQIEEAKKAFYARNNAAKRIQASQGSASPVSAMREVMAESAGGSGMTTTPLPSGVLDEAASASVSAPSLSAFVNGQTQNFPSITPSGALVRVTSSEPTLSVEDFNRQMGPTGEVPNTPPLRSLNPSRMPSMGVSVTGNIPDDVPNNVIDDVADTTGLGSRTRAFLKDYGKLAAIGAGAVGAGALGYGLYNTMRPKREEEDRVPVRSRW